MNCSVIIRSYNEERHIGRLIIGIQKQNVYDSQNVEIIVVDSGSTDSTVSIARHLGAIVIEIKKEEFSFGRALNIGCNSAKGDILVLSLIHI
jgi:rhamnosyltransferase